MSAQKSSHHYQIKTSTGTIFARRLGDESLPTVVVLGGISGTHNVLNDAGTGWWQGLSAAVDWQRFSLLTLDYPNGMGSSSRNPTYQHFSELVNDITEALAQLQPNGVAAIIGGSFGGSLALGLACQKALRCQAVVCIAAAHRAHAYAIALRQFQRQFVELTAATENSKQGIELARALAMLSYRDTAAFDSFYNNTRSVFDYVRSKSAQLMAQQPERVENLFRQFGPLMDSVTIDPQQIQQPVLLIGFSSDQLVPPTLMQELAEQLPHCQEYLELSSSYGHDGFIKDTQHYTRQLQSFLHQYTSSAAAHEV